jgi:alcohol dehydrogenase class IV
VSGPASELGLLRQPRSVLFGPGQRSQLPWVVKGLARHALFITDARMAASAEFAAMKAGVEAAGVTVSVFDQAEPDLPRSNIIAVIDAYGSPDTPIDAIVGIGGGSCMDLAKVVSVVMTNRGEVRDYYGEFKVPGPGIPVVAVPTTGGTGAEVTCIAVVFDDEANMKVGVASPFLEPVAAIIDPELTLTCPPGLTAATAADALSHLVESYTARYKNPSPEEIATKLYVGKNRLTDMFAREGLSVINHALERVLANPSDLQARSDMMYAAYCAGMCINTTGTAAAHAIQAPIAAVCHASHGFGVGALLPYVMRFNLPSRVPVFAEIAAALGVAEEGASELEQAQAGILRIEELLGKAGVPLNLKELGVPEESLPTIASQAMKATRLTVNNPREMTEAAVLGLVRRGYADDRSWWDDP